MASVGDEDTDAVLSDVEADGASPIVVKDGVNGDDVSVERFREVLAELDRERQAREAVEKEKSELQISFNRLRTLAHEAIKKRDAALKEREDVVRSNESTAAQLAEVSRIMDEATKQRDDIARQLEEASKARDGLRSEVESSAHMLVTGIEKISVKLSNFKNFSAGGFPRSSKYAGLPAVAYGVIKRTNEIVEELIRHIDIASKSRNEAREQIEQRYYEIAIEVSQLEATIRGLRGEVAEKNNAIENLEKNVMEKDTKAAEVEREMHGKINLLDNETMGSRDLESKMESQKTLLDDQLNLVSRIHERIHDVIKIVDGEKIDQSDVSESPVLPQETDLEENMRACLAGMGSIYDLTKEVVEKTKNVIEEKKREVKSLNETVGRLINEKGHIGSLLRSALSKRMALDTNSKPNELFQAAENGLREAGVDFKFSNLLKGGNKAKARETEQDEIYTLVGALENIVKTSQLQIIELQHSLEEVRAESSLLEEQIESQSKALNKRMQRIEELEEKVRVANESVEGLMLDIAAAEEEITRWKVAAEEEAAAGRAVEQEFVAQLSAIKQELAESQQAMLESEKKLKFKEETAAAAMAARDAAEKSLRLGDMRASRLRERVEELSRQLDEFETRADLRGRHGFRYVCWPWQWLGLDFVGFHKPETQQQISNEMELSEPLL